MNKYISPVIVLIILCLSGIFIEDYIFTILHIVLFILLTTLLFLLLLSLYGLINFVLNAYGKLPIGLMNFKCISSIIFIVAVVLATPSLCIPLIFKGFASQFQDGFLNNQPIQVQTDEKEESLDAFFLVDGFKFYLPNEKVYSRGSEPFRNIQLSSNQEDKVYITSSTNEKLGDSIVLEVKKFVYSGKYGIDSGANLLDTCRQLTSKDNYDMYKTIAMSTSKDLNIGASLEEMKHTYEMLLIKLLTMESCQENESYYYESDEYTALMLGAKVDFYKEDRRVSLMFDQGISLEERLFMMTHVEFDDLVLTEDYIVSNIPSYYDEDKDIRTYRYEDIANEQIPVGQLVFDKRLEVQDHNKVAIRLDVGISETEDIRIEQIIFSLDEDYDEIRIRNQEVKIIDKDYGKGIGKEIFCGNYQESSKEVVTKDIEFLKKIASSTHVELKIVTKDEIMVYEISENDKKDLKEFIALYESLLAKSSIS